MSVLKAHRSESRAEFVNSEKEELKVMKYIVHKRFKGKAICGDVNLPALTVCECADGIIRHDGDDICFATSENAHQFFAIDEDGMGMVRGRLTQTIQKALDKRDGNYQKRWDKVWEDQLCQQYKRTEYEDYWLWNHSFFSASIENLKYIAALIG